MSLEGHLGQQISDDEIREKLNKPSDISSELIRSIFNEIVETYVPNISISSSNLLNMGDVSYDFWNVIVQKITSMYSQVKSLYKTNMDENNFQFSFDELRFPELQFPPVGEKLPKDALFARSCYNVLLSPNPKNYISSNF